MRTKPVAVFRGTGGFNLPIELLVKYYRASTHKDPFFYRVGHYFPEDNPDLNAACETEQMFASAPKRSSLRVFTRMTMQEIIKVYHDKLGTSDSSINPDSKSTFGGYTLPDEELYISTADLGDSYICQDWSHISSKDNLRDPLGLLEEFPEYPSSRNHLDIYYLEDRSNRHAFRGDEVLCELIKEACMDETFCERYEIEVIDIPHDVEYEIDEGDSGYELIREVHRTW